MHRGGDACSRPERLPAGGLAGDQAAAGARTGVPAAWAWRRSAVRQTSAARAGSVRVRISSCAPASRCRRARPRL